MDNINDLRRTMTAEEREEADKIQKSLLVSSRTNEIYEAIETGKSIPKTGRLPDAGGVPRPEDHHIEMNSLFAAAANTIGPDGLKTAMSDVHAPREGEDSTFSSTTAHTNPAPSSSEPTEQSGPRFKISKNQATAIAKYPHLIEFIGGPEGHKIIKEIIVHANQLLASKVGENSKSISKTAQECTPDRQNLRISFTGEGWNCSVIANGPFRGDESIFYDKEQDKAYILRPAGNEFENITPGFNVIADFQVIEKQADQEIAEDPVAAEEIPHIAEDDKTDEN